MATKTWKKSEAGRRSRRKHKIGKRLRQKEYLDTLKDKPCVDCGLRFPPECMDFDHLPGQEKVLALSLARKNGWSDDKLRQETEKCEIVCANCHRIRTANRKTILASEFNAS